MARKGKEVIMRLSEKKKSALYAAIHEPIMQKRIHISQSSNVLGDKNAKDLDELMFSLNHQIWNQIKTVLKLEE